MENTSIIDVVISNIKANVRAINEIYTLLDKPDEIIREDEVSTVEERIYENQEFFESINDIGFSAKTKMTSSISLVITHVFTKGMNTNISKATSAAIIDALHL